MESNRVSRTAGRVVKAVACDVRVTAAVSVFVSAVVVYEYTTGAMDNATAAGVGALGWVAITVVNYLADRDRRDVDEGQDVGGEEGFPALDQGSVNDEGGAGPSDTGSGHGFEDPISPFVSADDQHRGGEHRP